MRLNHGEKGENAVKSRKVFFSRKSQIQLAERDLSSTDAAYSVAIHSISMAGCVLK